MFILVSFAVRFTTESAEDAEKILTGQKEIPFYPLYLSENPRTMKIPLALILKRGGI